MLPVTDTVKRSSNFSSSSSNPGTSLVPAPLSRRALHTQSAVTLFQEQRLLRQYISHSIGGHCSVAGAATQGADDAACWSLSTAPI
jgi:hypothetical protein